MPTLTIDNISVTVPSGSTILQAAQHAGVKIPTLCSLEGCQPIGACRICLVEVEGSRSLIASCAAPVNDGQIVHTCTRRVRDARRTVLELLLSEHEGNCQVCDRNNDCELQSLAFEMGITSISNPGAKPMSEKDSSTAALVRDGGKCVRCRRCVTVCSQVQNVGALFPQFRGFKTTIGPAFGKDLQDVVCVQCGQCAAVCPVGAISENPHIDGVWKALDDPTKTVVVQTAPAVRVALGECFGCQPGTLVTGKMVSALRALQFDYVFDTNFTADLTILEEGTELLMRLKKALVDNESVSLPMFTSCCPGWVKFMEHFHMDMLPGLSSCKSPQQMFGALAKTFFATKLGKNAEDIIVVSVMPCTAKKFEASREEMNASGAQDVDYVLTTRELGRMIRQAGIDFMRLPDGELDSPLGLSSGAADIFANTGGVMEAALRTAYEIVTGRELPFERLHIAPIQGLEGVKDASITVTGALPEWSFLENVTVNVAVAHGLANAGKVVEHVRSGDRQYHFIEVMACPGGCIGGGGQPRRTNNQIRASRIKGIYREDEGKKLRKSHDNPMIREIYADYLGEPLSETSHHLLHTHYASRGLNPMAECSNHAAPSGHVTKPRVKRG